MIGTTGKPETVAAKAVRLNEGQAGTLRKPTVRGVKRTVRLH
jgi:hypothetical protein